jgi:hypothetical protein
MSSIVIFIKKSDNQDQQVQAAFNEGHPHTTQEQEK